MRKPWLAVAAAVGLAWSCGSAMAADDDPTAKAIEEYRQMIQEGSPAELFEMDGEDLWHEKRGPKNASLEECDLGQGPGVVEGVFVTLPRYFEDTDRVQDLESRLVTCMDELQGIDPQEAINDGWGKGERANVTALATWIASQSRGMKFDVPQEHPKEKIMYEVGKRIFYQGGGQYDFSCATCHGQEDIRIRLQDLPYLSGEPGDGVGIAAWPAYRVSQGSMWSMERRLITCYRQQRFPEPDFVSDLVVALDTFMGVQAKGATSIASTIKR